ncbi:hypothetical protein Pfo_025908 [Paulownia fortunei]|nr:hypothetical protein Pfo_025908 [Paulownia fortunei]
MGSRSGFEYRYRFWMDDEIIPLYRVAIMFGTKTCQSPPIKCFLFEIRTNFILKTRLDDGGADEVMDSERYEASVPEDGHEELLEMQTSFRLKEYWMSDDEIQRLVHGAFDFAKQRAADPQHGSVIPVVVGLDVCTVQLDGEPLNATIDRAIRPECLIPLYLWPVGPDVQRRRIGEVDITLDLFSMDLPKIRVEDVDQGLALMEVCPICLHNPTIGAQISLLPCHHAFHNHCVVRWLQKSTSCPLCRFEIILIEEED